MAILGSKPDIASKNSAQSVTDLAIGPCVGSIIKALSVPGPQATPGLGRRPTTPQYAAGVRKLPPWSEPWLNQISPAAKEAAAPPEDPPALRVVSQGLKVGPKTSLNVFPPAPNSGVFVLPSTTPPHPSSRSTIGSLSVGIKLEYPLVPKVQITSLTFCKSFMVMGKPANQPGLSEFLKLRLAAPLRARSSHIVGVAFINGPVCEIRRVATSKSSDDETSPRFNISTTLWASMAHNSGPRNFGRSIIFFAFLLF